MEQQPWQRSAGALAFLMMMAAAAIGYGVIRAWPLAQAKHEGAVEVILMAFGFSALFIAGLGWGFGKRALVLLGGVAWVVAFYLSSLVLADLVIGNNAGIAIRVGAVAALAFLLAASRLK